MVNGEGRSEPVTTGLSMEKAKTKYKRYRRYIIESRQEISACLKYLLFLVNFIFWICGIACAVLGIYLYAKDYRAVFEAIDFFLNPSILLIISGCLIFVIAFLGCTGALRENGFMLKLFSLFLFFAYICLVILAFVVFMLFYSDTKTGLSISSLLQSGVHKYHDNDNMRELMDYLQTSLGCCGATSQGYKDWNMNPLYNCSSSNTNPEQCGVPSSCCKTASVARLTSNQKYKSSDSRLSDQTLSQSEHELPAVPSSPNIMRNPRCGFHAQDKSITDLQHVLYTDGCLQPLQRLFESNAIIIGAIIGAVIIPVCLSVTFSNVLAKQIERQRYLLEKEARKEERRRRRNRSKFRDPFEDRPLRDDTNLNSRPPKRSSNADCTTAPTGVQKETCTRLILEEGNENSEAQKAGNSKVGVKSKRNNGELPQIHAPIRKRSGNPDLPEIPSEQIGKGPVDKKTNKNNPNTSQAATDGPGQSGVTVDKPRRLPKLTPDPTVINDKRRKRQDLAKRRSKSKVPYMGPVIVEIDSITHDAPSTSMDTKDIVILDESPKEDLFESNANNIEKSEEMADVGGRRNSKIITEQKASPENDNFLSMSN